MYVPYEPAVIFEVESTRAAAAAWQATSES